MTESGTVGGPAFNLPARSRKTIFIADRVPDNWSVSTKVESLTPAAPVIAERSMYWSKEIAPPQPPPPPAPCTYDFSGDGNLVAPQFGLMRGVTLFDMNYVPGGDYGDFIVRVMDAQGGEVLRAAQSQAGYRGGRCLIIPANGIYSLAVVSQGTWQVHIEQPRPESAPGVNPPPPWLPSRMDAHLGFFALDTGVATFSVSNTPRTYPPLPYIPVVNNLVVLLYNSDGDLVDRVENSGGSFAHSKDVPVGPGIYILDVSGGGQWWVGGQAVRVSRSAGQGAAGN